MAIIIDEKIDGKKVDLILLDDDCSALKCAVWSQDV
jgi:hypothetical protein